MGGCILNLHTLFNRAARDGRFLLHGVELLDAKIAQGGVTGHLSREGSFKKGFNDASLSNSMIPPASLSVSFISQIFQCKPGTAA